MPLTGLSYQIASEVYPTDFFKMLAFEGFYSGTKPHMINFSLDNVIKSIRDIHIPDMDLSRAHSGTKSYTGLYTSVLATLLVECVPGKKGAFYITSTHAEQAQALKTWCLDNLKSTEDHKEEEVRIGFWHNAAGGPVRSTSFLEAPYWENIKKNYDKETLPKLENIVKCDPNNISGRLLLLHGAPGTGKSSFFRSLAREWASWCKVDVVLDPEVLFGQADYLLQVTLHEKGEVWDDDEGRYVPEGKWSLLLLEDCDELISAEAKSVTGQGLARLLNITDGILGKGSKSLIAITTNEDVNKFHPAVTRPGRCLANIEVPPLGVEQAQQWLGARGTVSSPTTLAQLYEIIAGQNNYTEKEQSVQGVGQYL